MHPRNILFVLTLLLCALHTAPCAADDDRHPRGKAPLVLLLDHLRGPAGLAIAPDGALYFTETKRGTLSRRATDGKVTVLMDRLDKPRGLARTKDGALLVVADEWRPASGPRQKGVLLKWITTGAPRVLASGFRNPQQIALGLDEIAVSSRKGLRETHTSGRRDDNDKDDDDSRDQPPGVVYRLNMAGVIQSSEPGFDSPSGLILDPDHTLTISARSAEPGDREKHGNVFQLTAAGKLSVLVKDRYDNPAGMVRDALGNIFLAVKREREDRDDGGLILKIGSDGHARAFGKHFDEPWGLAFDSAGNLYVGEEKHRIYRFRAPAQPVLSPVKYLAPATVTLSGKTEPSARVTILGGAGQAVSDADAAGQFSVAVALQPDRLNTLLIYATGAGGEGLTSAPAVLNVAPDLVPPTITAIAKPPPNKNGWNNTNVTVGFGCSDAQSGIAVCPAPVLLTQEGAHQIVQGTATDNADNSATAAVDVSIDKTPPSVGYSISPPPPASGWYTGDVIVTFTCSDDRSGVEICPGPLRPALDGPGVIVRGTATDRAGNSVTSIAQLNVDRVPPSVTIQSPAAGSVVTAASVRVNGVVSDATSGVAAVTCNGVAATVSPGVFACTVPLVAGANRITVTAIDRAGLAGRTSVSVLMTPASATHAKMEHPHSGMALLTPFQVWGWAIDPRATTGTGVDRVDVWAVQRSNGAASNGVAPQAAGPIFLGSASYGLDRPDIRQTLGDRFAPSGYAFTVRGLAPGDYTLQVSAHSTVTGTFDNVQTASVTVLRAVGGDPGGGPNSDSDIGVRYRAHVENLGWLGFVTDGDVAGTTGQFLRMEALQMQLQDARSGVHICYSAHVENIGWQAEVCDGQTAGTEGQSLRIEALKVRLVNAPAGTQVCYMGHVQSIGWMNEVCDGQLTGTEGQSLRMEAVRIRIKNPPQTLPPVSNFGTHYRAHVESLGWLGFVHDDEVSGTIGQSLRMEALQVGLDSAPSGTRICYEAHVQNLGWLGEVCDGQTAGTEGQGLRMEAMRARLVNAPEGMSVCYRAHVQDLGWMDEVCDSTVAGTIGQSRRVEAVRVRIRIPFHTFVDNGCTNWIPGFDLQFPICDPYRLVWLEQFARWFASGFSSYFIGLPRSSDKIQVFNPDINKDVPAQIYERGVLHIWPDEPTGIASMRLGELDRVVNGVPQSLNAPMASDFSQIWGSQGGLPVFGQSVSDAGFYPPSNRFSQYFERVRMERKPDGSGVEFGLLGVELEAAGLIRRKPAPGDYVAYVTCTACPPPLDRKLGWGYGDNCSAAYTAARQNCAEMSCTGASLELGCAPTNDDGF